MKHTIFLLLFCLLANFSSQAQNKNREFRSTWVITWEYISSSGTVDQKKAKIRTILDNHVKANMTSVLWQIRQAGTAYYSSSYEPWGSYAGGTYPGFDPLAYAIEEAHKRGLEIHGWFNVFASGSLVSGTPAQEHPEWICRDNTGAPMTSSICLSPGLPAVRTYLNQVAMEVIRNYDLDGFHLDYIRWNEYSSSSNYKSDNPNEGLVDSEISEEQAADLMENSAGRYLYDAEHPFSAGVPSGFTSWENWWRWSVTEFVKTLNDSIKSVKPHIRLSVAALGKYNWSSWCGYNTVYQDAALWLNEGYIDQIAGMHYHWTTGSGFFGMLAGACPQCWSQYIQPGVAAGRFFTVGPPSYILEENNIWNNHPEIINSIRSVSWADGMQFFSYGNWRDRNYWSEAQQKFFKKKTKIRAAKYLLDTIPSAPTVSIIKVDSLKYSVTVNPHSSTTKDQWFVVYRSEDNILSVDNDDIVAVKFGKTNFTIDELFNGKQDFNGRYNYFATMCDRFWNESGVSNAVLTDPIPSFAPIVESTVPAINDTAVSINSQLKLVFSKKMNTSTFPNALSITPAIQLNAATWSTDAKTVTYTFSVPLSFQTNYTVTVDSSAKDINGVAIDGNGDGVPGDPFILGFHTEELDNVGPNVTYSYPDTGNGTYQFDPEDIIVVVFDEKLNVSTVNNTNLLFRRNGMPLGRSVVINELSNRSFLSIKAGLTLNAGDSCQIVLKKEISDTYGNNMPEDIYINFKVAPVQYTSKTKIDDFSEEGNWKHPAFSGSTVGIIDSGSYFAYSTAFYLPATTPAMSAFLNYQWNTTVTTKLLREYLGGGDPQAVTFDTSKVLQVYIWGDGSRNKFRFAIDEGTGTSWPNHEVSKWITIDWIGWKLVEWQLNDPSSVGNWIGNGILDQPLYRMDSFQLTDDVGSATYSRIYFDNLQVSKKNEVVLTNLNENELIEKGFQLSQNYPNPFNPATVISYNLDKDSKVVLKVFDILGKEVSMLVNEEQKAGRYNVTFNASNLSSGVYFCRISAGENIKTIKMNLLK